MNFDYIKEAEPSTDDLRQLYDSLYQNLEKAEELYWTKPQRCGMMLRRATEKICRIYNGYYEIHFPESATLEDYSVIQEMMIIMPWSAVFKCCAQRAERPSGVASRVGR